MTMPLVCPECKAESGDNWIQCRRRNGCPMSMSPYFNVNHPLKEEAHKRIEAVMGPMLRKVHSGPLYNPVSEDAQAILGAFREGQLDDDIPY